MLITLTEMYERKPVLIGVAFIVSVDAKHKGYPATVTTSDGKQRWVTESVTEVLALIEGARC